MRAPPPSSTPAAGHPADQGPSARNGASPACLLRRLSSRHRRRQAREQEQAGPAWQDSGYVFTRSDVHPVEPATFTTHFGAPLHDAQLLPIRFHDLRYSTATLLLEQGIEFVVVKELLGRAHIGVTATVYAPVRLASSARLSTSSATPSATSPRPRSSPTTQEPTALCITRPLALPFGCAFRRGLLFITEYYPWRIFASL
ncbi:tyrosine-type recombinase/integrase [Streptomyces sp. NBC_01497]